MYWLHAATGLRGFGTCRLPKEAIDEPEGMDLTSVTAFNTLISWLG